MRGLGVVTTALLVTAAAILCGTGASARPADSGGKDCAGWSAVRDGKTVQGRAIGGGQRFGAGARGGFRFGASLGAAFAAAVHRLDLTQEQRNQIRPILADAAERVRAIRQNSGFTREQQIAEIRQVLHAARQRIRALLTPEQQRTLDEMREAGAQRGRERLEERRGARALTPGRAGAARR